MIEYISAFGTKDDRIKTMIERDKDGREMAEKTLLDQWRSIAYNEHADRNKLQALWQRYFLQERDIYAELLKNPDEVVSGTVKELAEKYGYTVQANALFENLGRFGAIRIDNETGRKWGGADCRGENLAVGW